MSKTKEIKAFIKEELKPKKKSKPWKKERGIFDNVSMKDLLNGFKNKDNRR